MGPPRAVGPGKNSQVSHAVSGPDYNNYDYDYDDTHHGWIIVRDGKFSVADKNTTK